MGNFDRGRGGSRDGNRDGRDRDRSGNRDGNRERRPFRRNFDSRPVEKHKAICSACKKECEVPFKPTEGREVFCQDCYKKNKGF